MSKKSAWSNTRILVFTAALEFAGWFAKAFARLLGTGSTADQQKALAAAVHAGPPQPARCQDVGKDLQPGSDLMRRERWGTFFVTCAALVGICAGIGFVYVYWAEANDTLVLGGCLALFFGGLGIALVSWAHNLMRHREAVEPREVLPSSPEEIQLTFENFTAGKRDVKRRTLLTYMGLGFLGVFAASAISLFRSLGIPPGPSLYDRIWKPGQRLMTEDGSPVSIHALRPGDNMLVYPENSVGDERAQTMLIRVDEHYLRLPPDRAGWAPMGYLAYSRVCTHAGCPVALYQKQTHLLLCPCHQSSFDVLNGAQPTGGPAARPLPQLPLYADADGTLRAAGAFTTPPGPGFWGMPA